MNMSNDLTINEKCAWEKFSSTGKIQDYLEYNEFKCKNSLFGTMTPDGRNGGICESSSQRDSDKGS